MKLNRKLARGYLAVLAGIAMSACGGGGSSSADTATSPPTTSFKPLIDSNAFPEGVYLGSTSDGRGMAATIEADGNTTLFYTSSANYYPSDSVWGGVQGTITAANGSYSSPDAMGFDGMGAGTRLVGLSGSYSAQASIQGTINGSSIGLKGTTFDLTYSTELSNAKPSLSTVVGAYTGSQKSTGIPSTSEPITLFVAADGNVTGYTVSAACSITGNVAPTTTGSTYRIDLQYNGSCYVGNQTFSGVFLFDPSGIIGLAPNKARDNGVIFEADKVR